MDKNKVVVGREGVELLANRCFVWDEGKILEADGDASITIS